MSTEVLQGPIGPETKYNVKIEGGKVVAEITYAGALLGAELTVSLDALAVLDAIAAKIPGHFDDLAIEGAKLLLKAQT